MALMEHVAGGVGSATAGERVARDDLRAQIARLERELAHLAASTYPRLPAAGPVATLAPGPRVLGLGELERVRDGLAARLTAQRAAAAEQAARQAEARALLERMYADPPAHRRRRLTNADLGVPGCATYEVVPRLGLVGMLAHWWEVKVSSGCPLSALSRRRAGGGHLPRRPGPRPPAAGPRASSGEGPPPARSSGQRGLSSAP
jgi:hypothetical protein